jgi:hypothetical protein
MNHSLDHGWCAFLHPNGYRSVMPVNDYREHEVSDVCWCRPTLDDGVLIHHSMDRREEYERGERRVS